MHFKKIAFVFFIYAGLLTTQPVAAFAATDSDGDGLSDTQESFLGTNIYARDTDGDGLDDNEEVDLLGTDPTLFDTNPNDGLVSDYEVDNDKDGLTNGYEVNDWMAVGTVGNFTGEGGNPNNFDTDEDGLGDLFEFTYTAACGLDITVDDGDHDGVKDANEDCDGDGMSNLVEFENGTDPAYILEPERDDDADGLTNAEEALYGTDPNDADTDDDYYSDLEEITASTPSNPLKNRSTPARITDTDGDRLMDLYDRDDDNDGVADATELANGTSPRAGDSDGDGVSDKNDAFPLDAAR